MLTLVLFRVLSQKVLFPNFETVYFFEILLSYNKPPWKPKGNLITKSFFAISKSGSFKLLVKPQIALVASLVCPAVTKVVQMVVRVPK